jgi:hypothetical protein
VPGETLESKSFDVIPAPKKLFPNDQRGLVKGVLLWNMNLPHCKNNFRTFPKSNSAIKYKSLSCTSETNTLDNPGCYGSTSMQVYTDSSLL